MRRSHVLPTLGLALALSAVNLHARSAPPAGGPALTPVSSNRPALTPGNGKLLLTGGVSSIDGAAGGGLTPWAMVGSYATTGEFGGIAFITHATTQTDTLARSGASAGFDDCFELSLARQEFNASVVVPDTALRLDIVGIKLRVAGDAVLDSVAAKRDGVDLYASATKLFLAPGILVNGTLRATKANQNGLLGFGSSRQGGYQLEPELSVAWLLRKNLALGAECRFKPNNLAFAGAAFTEDDWKDRLIAWAPTKNVPVTAAFVDLGNIVGHRHQTGGCLSAQLAH